MNESTTHLRRAIVAVLFASAMLATWALCRADDDAAAEPPVAVDWGGLSESVVEAKDACDEEVSAARQEYETAMTEAEQTRDVGLARAEDDLVEAFDKAIKSAERRDNDDDVMALEEAKSYTLDPPAPQEGPTPETAILGAWLFTFADGTSETFVFFSDGKIKDETTTGAEHSGSWSVDAIRVRIQWASNVWAVMRLPLGTSGTVGDDMYGLEAFVAVKLDEDENADEVDWDELPKSVQRAKKRNDKDVAEAEEDYEQAIAAAERRRRKALNEAIRPLLRELEKAMKAAEKEDDVDAMADIARAIKYVKRNMGPRSTADILLGIWTTEAGRWKFMENGSVAMESRTGATDVGQWRLTGDYVSVVWTSQIPRDDDGPSVRAVRGTRRTPGGTRTSTVLVPNLDEKLPVPWAVRKRGGGPRWSGLRLPLDEAGTVVDSWEGLADMTLTKWDEDND